MKTVNFIQIRLSPGNFAESTQAADVDAVLDEIKAVIAEEQERLREAQEHNN